MLSREDKDMIEGLLTRLTEGDALVPEELAHLVARRGYLTAEQRDMVKKAGGVFPEGEAEKKEAGAPEKKLEKMTRAELVAHAATVGVETNDDMTKPQIIEAINAKG